MITKIFQKATLVIVLLLGVIIGGVITIATQEVEAQVNTEKTYQQLNLFGEVFDRVRKYYVEKEEDEKLIENALNGMLSALDPHSGYLNKKSFEDMRLQTRGKFGGLGIEVTMENGLVKVVSPIDDTPAARAGLKTGDLISHIDDKPIIGMTLSDAVDKMRGKPKTKIKLTIRRKDVDPFDVTIVRDVITIKAVKWNLEDDNIGYIRITTFNEQTEKSLKEAIKEFQEKTKGKMIGIVIDLRNNPGGLLDQAVAVSDAFLNKGEIVSTRGRQKDDGQRFNARSGDLLDGLPIIVLINEGSASASEIVAGALQDHHRAILVGTKSFGKGSVQTIIPLPGHGAMRLTTARYYTPSGRSIQAEGIVPDIKVQQADLKIVERAHIVREKDLNGALKNTDKSLSGSGDEKHKGGDKEADKKQDYQKDRALDLLRGIVLYKSFGHLSAGEQK